MFCGFILIGVISASTDALFFGSFGGGGGGCSCPPAPPPPVCPQQQACPPVPSCGPPPGPPPQQFVPQFQQQPVYQQGGFLGGPPPPPPPPQVQQSQFIPQGGFGTGGYALQPGPPPVAPGPPQGQQNFVPYEQPPPLPPPPPPAVQIPSPVASSNNENYDYEHFAQKTDSYANNEQSPQVEVEPSYRNAEQPPLDESDPNNVFLPGKTLKKMPTKPLKKIRPPPLDHTFDEDFITTKASTRAPTTTTTTTTVPPPPKTTTPEDIYDDDKLPDIDEDYYENSTNKSKKLLNDRYSTEKKLKSDLLTNDYSENSFKSKVAGVKSRIASELTDDNKCGDPFLRRIMTENIVASPTISKQLIFTAGKQHYNKSIDVVCSKNKFSYTVVSTKVFCEVTVKPVTCFAFFQPANLKKQRRRI